MRLSDTRFEDLRLHPDLLRGIQDCGFTQLTEVQARSLPITLTGKDLAVQAQTGSGKTAAFVASIFQHLLDKPAPEDAGVCPRALVVTPTRELAVQVTRDAEAIGRHLPFKIHTVYGGVDYRKQRDILGAGVDLLIGTPGRLIDYLKQKVYHLRAVEVAVIDEADRMFDMGFIGDIRFLLRRMSRYDQRQSMLFSATLGDRVVELSYEYMNVPDLVEVSPDQVTVDKVEQKLYHTNSADKMPLLLGILQQQEWTKALVFVNTKRAGEDVRRRLAHNGFPAAVLSGDVSQPQRLSILRRFTSGEVRILVATDVASRGLHVDAISHVFNYDLPQNAEDYVHRIGRTARAGASGKAISLACEDYVYSLEEIESYIAAGIPTEMPPPELLAEEKPLPARARRSGRPPKGGRSQRGSGGRSRSGSGGRSGADRKGGSRRRRRSQG